MWTLEGLRKKTAEARDADKAKRDSERADRIGRRADQAIQVFDDLAYVEASKGGYELCVFEAYGSEHTLDDETRDAIKKIEAYFQDQGFNTRIHYYTTGGPSHFENGVDLYVIWEEKEKPAVKGGSPPSS